MAITFIQQKKRQQILVFLVAGMAILALLVLWFGFFSSAPREASSSFSLPSPREVSIDFGVFENPVFQELGSPFPPVEVPAKTEKANPFIRPR
ncbi:MAG: hypothetical protein HYV55_01660 [Parcubacteria group bacterium]|nr:hypothetical protein [Parcubacteria group bacterium]